MERKTVGRAGYSNDQYKEIILRNIGQGYNLDKVSYTGRYCTVTITCEKHGDFDVKANSLLVRRIVTPCKRCHANKWLANFISRSDKAHGYKYDYSKVVFPEGDQDYTVVVVCSEHGDFKADAYSHMQGRYGCPHCYKARNRTSTPDFIKKSIAIHGDRYIYDKVNYVNGRTHVEITCKIHGIFRQYPDVHLSGSGCRECFSDEFRMTTNEFVAKAKEVHGDNYDYSRTQYISSKVKLTITCYKHGEFTMTPNAHLACRQGCPRCKESKGETRIRKFLQSSGIEFIQEYKIPGSLFRYDFMINDSKTLIEFQGQQHFKPVERFGGVDAYRETRRRDALKQRLALENGFVLLRPSFKMLKENRLEKYLTRHLIK